MPPTERSARRYARVDLGELMTEGGLTLDQRLARIESTLHELDKKVDHLAPATEVKELSTRMLLIERDYAPRAWLAGSFLVNILTIIGLLYEMFKR